jgi:hypothetical protein
VLLYFASFMKAHHVTALVEALRGTNCQHVVKITP